MLDRELNNRPKRGHRRRKRGIYLLPNLLTTGSLFCGFYSIVASIEGNYEFSAIAIVVAALLDGLDGRVARLTGTSSRFGVEYDSLSDLVSFGIAPALLIFNWALKPFGRYGWLAAFLFVVAGALRLARFNVQVSTVESRRFTGLPIPAAATLVASTVLLFHYFGQEAMAKHITIPVLVYLLAFLMISNIKYYSFKEFDLSKRMPFRLLVALIFLLVLVAAEPPLMLFLLTFGYVISGPVLTLWEGRNRMRAKHKSEEKATQKAYGEGHERQD